MWLGDAGREVGAGVWGEAGCPSRSWVGNVVQETGLKLSQRVQAGTLSQARDRGTLSGD